jgi:hypothetical protein
MNARLLTVALALSASLAGCRAIEGIFEAGFWVGAIIVGIVLLLALGASKLLSR